MTEAFKFDPHRVYPESKWSKASDSCPHPEWWHSTDPQSTELEVSELIGGFIRALQPEYVVETGSCLGITSQLIGLALKANGHGHLDTLEVMPERAEYVRKMCDDFLPVTVHETPSLEFTPAAPINFAFLDSLIDLRIPEFNRFREHLAPGAVVAFHDTAPRFGAYGANIRALPGVQALQLNTPRGITLVQVREG